VAGPRGARPPAHPRYVEPERACAFPARPVRDL
jgi:hypothetical protein